MKSKNKDPVRESCTFLHKVRQVYKDLTDPWEYGPCVLTAIRINRITGKVQYQYSLFDTKPAWYDIRPCSI